MAHKGHEQWTIFANTLIDSGKHFNVKTCQITDEVSLIKTCNTPELRTYLTTWLSKLNQARKRSLKVAWNFRSEGVKYFDEYNGNDLSADYHTKAIFSAPKDSTELAMGHLNRAGCLVHSDRFIDEGYFDCQMALQLNFPKHKLPALFEIMLQLASLSVDSETRIRETKAEMRKRQIRLSHDSVSFLESAAELQLSEQRDTLKTAPIIENKKLIESTNVSDRRLTTTERIEKDEQIYSEKAFAFVPAYSFNDMDEIRYTCQNCAQINCIPFPCYECVRASYCSPACLAEHQLIHKYECVGYGKNLWSKLGNGHLAFRTFMVGFNELVQILERKLNRRSTVDEVYSVLTADWIEEFPSYGRVLRIPSLIHKMDTHSALRFALTAQLLTIYLVDYTDFFKELPSVFKNTLVNVKDRKIVIAALLLRHMVQANRYGFPATLLQMMPPVAYRKSYGYGLYKIRPDHLHLVLNSAVVFTAFYPRLSTARHSCDPNVTYISKGLHLCAYANRDIDENEELFVSYGPRYKILSTSERQHQLKAEFFFDCKCDRCVMPDDEEWLKYYEYYCTDLECNVYVELDDIVDKRWWYYMGSDYCDNIQDEFVCVACGKDLPINPAMMSRIERAALGHIRKNGIAFHSNDKYVVAKHLLDLYFTVRQCLGKYHEMKTRLAHMVLGYLTIDADIRLFPRFAYTTMENYVNREERYGINSLEFLLLSAHSLCILKMATRIEETNTLPQMARDIIKIRYILNVDKIEKALQILPDALQTVFRNIIHEVRWGAEQSAVNCDSADLESRYKRVKAVSHIKLNGGNLSGQEKYVQL